MSKVAQDAWKITSLSGHTSDTAPALSLNFSNKTYLFGAGENLLRNLLVQKQTFTKFGPLFLSQLDQENAGGLYGKSPSSLSIVNAEGSCVNLQDTYMA